MQRCLDSIKIQTYKDFEVIISDNSTTSAIEDLANEYQKELLIYYHKNDVNLGAVKNFNKAINLSRGEYINLVMSDDYFVTKETFEILHAYINRNPKYEIFIANSFTKREDVLIERKITPTQVKNFSKDQSSIYLGNIIGTPSKVIFSRQLKYVNYNEELSWFGDSEYYMRLASSNKVAFIDYASVVVDENSSDRQTFSIQKNPQLIIFQHFIFFTCLKFSRNYLKYFVYFVRSTKDIDKSTLRKIKNHIKKNKKIIKIFYFIYLKLYFLIKSFYMYTQRISNG